MPAQEATCVAANALRASNEALPSVQKQKQLLAINHQLKTIN